LFRNESSIVLSSLGPYRFQDSPQCIMRMSQCIELYTVLKRTYLGYFMAVIDGVFCLPDGRTCDRHI